MNCVIYARYSSDGQREESVEGQLRECKEFAERHNMIVLSSYIDRARSAVTDDRPEFQQMIHDVAMMVGVGGTSKTGKVHHYYKCGNAIYKKSCNKKTVQKA
jgi:predicted site-specific integrase-resolvase